jgi:hypothetical protein
MNTEGSSPGLKQLEREVDHSPAISADVKNEWSYTPTPPIRLHGTENDKFTFLPLPLLL